MKPRDELFWLYWAPRVDPRPYGVRETFREMIHQMFSKEHQMKTEVFRFYSPPGHLQVQVTCRNGKPNVEDERNLYPAAQILLSHFQETEKSTSSGIRLESLTLEIDGERHRIARVHQTEEKSYEVYLPDGGSTRFCVHDGDQERLNPIVKQHLRRLLDVQQTYPGILGVEWQDGGRYRIAECEEKDG